MPVLMLIGIYAIAGKELYNIKIGIINQDIYLKKDFLEAESCSFQNLSSMFLALMSGDQFNKVSIN
jgi:hypothetical protein